MAARSHDAVACECSDTPCPAAGIRVYPLSPPVRFGAEVVLECCLADEVAGAGDAKVLAVGRQVLIQLHPAEKGEL